MPQSRERQADEVGKKKLTEVHPRRDDEPLMLGLVQASQNVQVLLRELDDLEVTLDPRGRDRLGQNNDASVDLIRDEDGRSADRVGRCDR